MLSIRFGRQTNKTIPHIDSQKSLAQFLKKTGINVILAASSVPDSSLNVFPQELADAIASFAPKTRMAMASPSILMAHDSIKHIAYQDGFIFADGKLYWRSESQFPTDPNALIQPAAVIKSFVDLIFSARGDHLKHKHDEIVNRVRQITLERLLKNKKPRGAQPKPRRDEDPYKTLDLSPNCTWEEIRSKRKELLVQYHPDKVATTGPKLRDVAEAETKKINAAFEQLERRHKPIKGK